MQKSIEIGKISHLTREFERSSKCLVTSFFSASVRFNISNYLLGCKPYVISTTISNWFLFILQWNWKKTGTEISFNLRSFLRWLEEFSYTSRQFSANPNSQLVFFQRVLWHPFLKSKIRLGYSKILIVASLIIA